MRVLVTGSNGLCGSAIRRMSSLSHHDFHFSNRNECNLLDSVEVECLFRHTKPDCVIHAAAKVGGVGMNKKIPFTLCSNNLVMNNNIISSCVRHSVKQLMAFSSVCVFPDQCEVLSEDNMHDGAPYDGTLGYAHSKRMVDVLIEAASREYGKRNWTSIIPGNIFGPNDLYDVNYGHVIPSLIIKLYHAKSRESSFNVWGSGEAEREFIYVDDLARVLIESIGKSLPSRLLVCGRESLKIREIVKMLCKIANYDNVIWDTDMPNGS